MRNYTQNAIFSAFVMTNLINDLLDQAKLDNEVFELHNEYFNICQTVQEVFQIVSFPADGKKIRLLLELDNMHPNMVSKIYSDKRRFL